MKSVLLILTSTYLASCLPPPHPAVVQVRKEEELIPSYLRSSALHNPHLRNILPLTSVLHQGENPVYQREADNVSRQEIYKLLTHAGFLPRRPPQYQPDPFHQPPQRINSHQHQQHSQHNSFEPPALFANPDLLQHL